MPGVFQGAGTRGHTCRGGKAAQHQAGKCGKRCQRQAAHAQEARQAGRDLIARGFATEVKWSAGLDCASSFPDVQLHI